MNEVYGEPRRKRVRSYSFGDSNASFTRPAWQRSDGERQNIRPDDDLYTVSAVLISSGQVSSPVDDSNNIYPSLIYGVCTAGSVVSETYAPLAFVPRVPADVILEVDFCRFLRRLPIGKLQSILLPVAQRVLPPEQLFWIKERETGASVLVSAADVREEVDRRLTLRPEQIPNRCFPDFQTQYCDHEPQDATSGVYASIDDLKLNASLVRRLLSIGWITSGERFLKSKAVTLPKAAVFSLAFLALAIAGSVIVVAITLAVLDNSSLSSNRTPQPPLPLTALLNLSAKLVATTRSPIRFGDGCTSHGRGAADFSLTYNPHIDQVLVTAPTAVRRRTGDDGQADRRVPGACSTDSLRITALAGGNMSLLDTVEHYESRDNCDFCRVYSLPKCRNEGTNNRSSCTEEITYCYCRQRPPWRLDLIPGPGPPPGFADVNATCFSDRGSTALSHRFPFQLWVLPNGSIWYCASSDMVLDSGEKRRKFWLKDHYDNRELLWRVCLADDCVPLGAAFVSIDAGVTVIGAAVATPHHFDGQRPRSFCQYRIQSHSTTVDAEWCRPLLGIFARLSPDYKRVDRHVMVSEWNGKWLLVTEFEYGHGQFSPDNSFERFGVSVAAFDFKGVFLGANDAVMPHNNSTPPNATLADASRNRPPRRHLAAVYRNQLFVLRETRPHAAGNATDVDAGGQAVVARFQFHTPADKTEHT